jgi:hypothetical protein
MKTFLTLLTLMFLTACSAYVTPIPTSTPKPAPLHTVSVPTGTAKAATQAREAITVTISQAVVIVRQSAGGEATGKYVRSGERVQIVRCSEDWCEIRKPHGFIFRGCIAELADGLLCQAKP